MSVLRFDSVGGASGDMVLGALVDVGVDAQQIAEELKALPVEDFDLRAVKAESHGIHGTRIEVGIPHDEHHHHHRSFSDIRDMIRGSSLSDGVKERSIAVFQRLAEAEATVHNKPVEDVHFHEVGALDSIIDIVGACIALEHLQIDDVVVNSLPLGSGTVECQHGVYPVPAPATVLILRGHPTVQTEETSELVTPTGAALLMTWKSMDRAPADSAIEKVGYGFGKRKLNTRPAALRAMVLNAAEVSATNDECLVLETNLDDTVPELMGPLTKQLLDAGALDVFTTSVQMKKQRSGTLLTVLCRPKDRESMLDLIFRESTTFGVREYLTRRTKLERRFDEVETPFGSVRVKVGVWKGRDVTHAPEMDDCVKRADERTVPVREVYEAAAESVRRK